jgi:type I restriction enzyme S subunit
MSDLPSDWINRPLGDCCKVQGGFAFKSGNYTKNGKGVPIIKIGDLQNGRVNVSEKSTRVPAEFLENRSLENFLLRNGDILIAMTGATTGKTAKYNSNASGSAFLNQRVGRFLVDNELLLQEFIQFLAQTDVFQQRIQENILAAVQGNISPKKLESIQIPLPPLPEQKAIAHILSTVQRAIEVQERIIQTTTELKKTLMHKLFIEGLRNEPQKQIEIGPAPESWEIAKVDDVAKIQSGGTPTRDVPENWTGGTIPWVKTGEIDYCVIKDTEETASGKSQPDLVCLQPAALNNSSKTG